MADKTATQLMLLRGEDLTEAVMNNKWYPRLNDTIGGWCVMPVEENPSGGCFEVADFIDEIFAKHIADLHNEWLVKK